MFEAQFWKLLRNSKAQPKFIISYKKKLRDIQQEREGAIFYQVFISSNIKKVLNKFK